MPDQEKPIVSFRGVPLEYVPDILKGFNTELENKIKKTKSIVPWSTAMKAHISESQVFLETYFDQFGITQLASPHILQTTTTRENVYAGSAAGVCFIPTALDQPSEEATQFMQTRAIIKEVYHASVTNYLNIFLNETETYPGTDTKKLKRTTIDRLGISYRHVTALEEGLGYHVLAQAKGFLHQTFPHLERQWSQNVRILIDLIPNLPNDTKELFAEYPDQVEAVFLVPNVDIESLPEDQRIQFSAFHPGIGALRIVNYLEEQIPDFLRLVEHARMCDETLAFARTVTKRFGIEIYKKIVTTPMKEEPMAILLEELSAH